MKAKQIVKMGNIYRLYKLIQPTGIIFFIESLHDDAWKIIDSTADIGLLAARVVKWGIASDYQQALRLLNR